MKLGIVLKILFHIVGLSCLGGAVFLGLLVFYYTIVTGVFYGIEVNHVTSSIEFFCMLYAATYLTFLAGHTIINYTKRG
jgi:hypothetical protein